MMPFYLSYLAFLFQVFSIRAAGGGSSWRAVNRGREAILRAPGTTKSVI